MKLIAFFCLLTLVACNRTEKQADKKPADWSKDHSVSYHKEINEREQITIGLYLDHRDKPARFRARVLVGRRIVFSRHRSRTPLGRGAIRLLLSRKRGAWQCGGDCSQSHPRAECNISPDLRDRPHGRDHRMRHRVGATQFHAIGASFSRHAGLG